MPFLSLATVVVEFFTFLMQKLDWRFDILNKKEWNQLNCSSLSFYGDIYLFIYFFLWHHGPCVPWGWCVRSAGRWLRMRSRCQPIKAGRNQSDAQQPAASPPTPRLLPVWEHSSAFLASFFSVFAFSLPTSNSFSSHACLWWVEESSRKRQKLHLSLFDISSPLDLFKDLCKANLQPVSNLQPELKGPRR